MADSYSHGKAFVSVHKSENRPGNLMYVILDDRATFDLIDLPVTDHGPKEHGHVITKHIETGPQYVVFQHWIK
jgi:hypothetical protein